MSVANGSSCSRQPADDQQTEAAAADDQQTNDLLFIHYVYSYVM